MLARKRWGVLLLILAAPLIVIGGALATGLTRTSRQEVFAFAVLTFVVGTATTTMAARARKPDLSKGIDEQAITVEGVLVGASAAFGLGAVSFALAGGWPVVGLAGAAAGAAWVAIWLPPRFRLITAESSIIINRDVPAGFPFLSDFPTMVKWDPRCEAVATLPP